MSDIIKTILEMADLQAMQPDFSVIKLIEKQKCENIQTIVFGKEKNTLKILTTNNFPDLLQKLLKMLEEKWYRYELFYTSTEWFAYALGRYDQLIKQETRLQEDKRAEKLAIGKWAISIMQKLFQKKDSMDPGEFILQIISMAFQAWASDLHFQPQDKEVLVRVRIDGVLQEVMEFSHDDFRQYLQKIKFISGAKMNIDYLPEDGKFNFEVDLPDGGQKTIDARVSFMPGIEEESTVIRFLDSEWGIKTFDQLWFVGKHHDMLKKYLEKNTGIIIFSGPTNSWKTTTLYSILQYLNDGKEKIITLEDPIEYEIAGIQQSQINYDKGYTYEVGLKSILRHDPDIILVWETRTLETAETSINAAMTWHLVFTTLHTNSAIESIDRLVSMWVKPYMLSSALNLIIGQRLVRKLCPFCTTKRVADFAENAEITESIKKMKDIDPDLQVEYHNEVAQSVWCDHCNGTGYIGRIVLLEVFEVSENIKKLIVEGKSTVEIYGKARENGYMTMKEDGMIKVLQGLTTLDEIRRVL